MSRDNRYAVDGNDSGSCATPNIIARPKSDDWKKLLMPIIILLELNNYYYYYIWLLLGSVNQLIGTYA